MLHAAGRRAARLALEFAWSTLHPGAGPWLEGARPAPSAVLPWRASDGARGRLLVQPPEPGGSGEPVVLAAGLGSSPTVLDWGPAASLARACRAAGHAVYLFEPRGAEQPPTSVDGLVERDVPAALAAVREHAGHPRVLWVGHGLGGLLGLLHAAATGQEDLAALVLLAAPVRPHPRRTWARAAAAARLLLPPGARLPCARLAAPLALSDPSLLGHSGPMVRGWLLGGVRDLRAGVVRQVLRWMAEGRLADARGRGDAILALHGRAPPLLAVAAEGDPLAPPRSVAPLAEVAPGTRLLLLDASWGHLDLLVDPRAPSAVHPPVLDFLDHHRRATWTTADAPAPQAVEEAAARAG